MISMPPGKAEFLQILQTHSLSFAPLAVDLVQSPQVVLHMSTRKSERSPGVISITWRNKQASYVFDYSASASPNALAMSRMEVIMAATPKLRPLVVAPFLSEESLQHLNDSEISGLDLCGNCALIARDFSVWRSGHPNRFKEVKTIRNPFVGDSSIFARCFLLRPEFESLSELQRFARSRMEGTGTSSFERVGLALGTASKVTKALVEELIVSKDGNKLRLNSAERLLSLLRNEGRSPRRGHSDDPSLTIIGKTPLAEEEVWARLTKARRKDSLRAVATGIASAGYHRVLSGVETLSFYVDDAQAAKELLEVRVTGAFANIRLHQEQKNIVYFDARREADRLWASPIQTWLELTERGPREQEAARDIERRLIDFTMKGQASGLTL